MPKNAQTQIIARRVPDQPCIQALLVVAAFLLAYNLKTWGQLRNDWSCWSCELQKIPNHFSLQEKNTLAGAFLRWHNDRTTPILAMCGNGSSWGPNFGKKNTDITCRPGKPSGPFAEALCLWQGFSAFTCAQTHPHSQKVMSWVEQGFTLPPAGESGDTIPEIDWHPRSLSSKCLIEKRPLIYFRYSRKTINFFDEQSNFFSRCSWSRCSDLRPKPSDWSSLNRLRHLTVFGRIPEAKWGWKNDEITHFL